MKTKSLLIQLLLFAVSIPYSVSYAQGTAFTYQGRLNAGTNLADGSYDIQFAVYDASTNGNQIGSVATNAARSVSNGLFAVVLDFGENVFTGPARWLDIAVRTNGGSAFTELAPRQQITSAPYAIQSLNAGTAVVASSANSVSAANINGTIAPWQLPGAVITNGANGVMISGTFAGDGSGVTNLQAGSLVVALDPVVGWGDNYYGQLNEPSGLGKISEIAVGYLHTLALKSDGTVVAWGNDGWGQTDVPPDLANVVAIAAGDRHNLALKSDGTVVSWGRNDTGQTNVPPGLSNVVAVSGGDYHSLALKVDGTVVGWGYDYSGQATPPVGLSNVVAISAGGSYSMALKSDGTVAVWGNNSFGQTNVPSGLSNVVAISAGELHNLALKNDGTVVAWGYGSFGQTSVPLGLSNVVAISGGSLHSLALKSDGTVVGWGYNTYGEISIPANLDHVVSLAQGCAANHAYAFRNSYLSLLTATTTNVQFNAGINVIVGSTLRAGNFLGDGSGLTNLSASQITGSIPDARLSANVALLNRPIQTFAGTNNFAGYVGIGTVNPTIPLNVRGIGGGSEWVSFRDTNDVPRWHFNGLQGGLNFAQTSIADYRLFLSTNGNVGVGLSNPTNKLHVLGGATFSSGGSAANQNVVWIPGNASWSFTSDRNTKTQIQPVDPLSVLEKVCRVPVAEWNYIGYDQRHIGPMAQDFHEQFPLNSNDKALNDADLHGVELAAIQGLYRKLGEKDVEISELKARLANLERLIDKKPK